MSSAFQVGVDDGQHGPGLAVVERWRWKVALGGRASEGYRQPDRRGHGGRDQGTREDQPLGELVSTGPAQKAWL
jgi:hypothetical protein